jgi:NADH:ubiquinone oxidoreductase subunit 4 (subunit M)
LWIADRVTETDVQKEIKMRLFTATKTFTIVAALLASSNLLRVDNKASSCLTARRGRIMANLSKLIFCAAMAAVSITTPALAVHKSTPMSHQNAYGTRSSQGSGVYSVPRACSFDCDWY